MVVDGIRYINTGAWTELPTHYLHVTADEMMLKQVDPTSVSHLFESEPEPPIQRPSDIHVMDASQRSAASVQGTGDFAP
jgi:hypothetical protein